MDRFEEAYKDKTIELESRNREITLLEEIAFSLSETLDLDEIAGSVLEKSIKLSGLDAGVIFLIDKSTPPFLSDTALSMKGLGERAGSKGVLKPITSVGISDEGIRCLDNQRLGDGPCGKAVKSGDVVALKNISKESKVIRMALMKENFNCLNYVPLTAKEDTLGVMLLLGKKARSPSPHEVRLFKSVGALSGMAIKNVMLFNETKTLTKKLSSIFDSSRSLSSSLDLNDILDGFVKKGVETVESAQTGLLMLYHAEENRLMTRSSFGMDQETLKNLKLSVGEFIIGEVFKSGEANILNSRSEFMGRMNKLTEEQRKGFLIREDDGHRSDGGHPVFPESSVCVPIIIREKTLGTLTLFGVGGKNSFSSSDLEILNVIASQTAVSIENANLYEDLYQQLTQTQALERISEWINSELNLKGVLNAVVENSRKILGADRCGIFLHDEGMEDVECVFSRNLSDKYLGTICDNFRMLYGSHVISPDHPVVIFDTHEDPRLEITRAMIKEEGIRSQIALPLRSGMKKMGVIFLYHNTPRFYSEAEVHLAQSFANQAAIAIENATLYHEALENSVRLKAKIQAMALRSEIDRAILSPIGTEDVFKTILRNLRRIVPCEEAYIMLRDKKETDKLTLSALDTLGEVHLSVGMKTSMTNSMVGRVVRVGEPIFCSDIDGMKPLLNVDWDFSKGITRSCVIVPLMIREGCIGAIGLGSYQKGFFNEEQLSLASDFAGQAAVAIEHARIYRELNENIRRLSVKQDIDHAILSSLYLEDVLDLACDHIIKFIQCDRVSVDLVDNSRDGLRVMAISSKYRTVLKEGTFIPFRETIEERVVKDLNPIIQLDLENRDDLTPTTLKLLQDGIRSLLILPLIIRNKAIGTLTIGSLDPYGVSTNQIPFIQDLVNQLAIAIERASLFKEVSEKGDFIGNVLNTTPNAITVFDKEMKLVEFNKAAEMLTGYTGKEALGKSFIDFYPEGELNKIRRAWEMALREGSIRELETSILTKDGERVPIMISISILKDQKDKVIGSVGISTDLRPKKRMEEVMVNSTRLKALGELASGVAHDFNNLLASIQARSKLMIKKTESTVEGSGMDINELLKSLKVMEKLSSDGMETVKRIQKFTKAHEDRYFIVININDLIEDVRESSRIKWVDEAGRKRVEIEFITSPGEVEQILGNPSELRDALTNLVFNAVDAMTDGGRLEITTSMEGDMVVIKVMDTGCGMEEETKKRLFEPFFSTKEEGWGLGLHVVRDAVKGHGGKIEFSSESGAGSTFIIKIPMYKEGKTSEVSEHTPEEKPPRRGRVLVIDDNEEIREVLFDILAGGGNEVITAMSGAEGLSRFREYSGTKYAFDMVFTDLELRDVTGWEVASQIKMLDPKIKIALITGWGDLTSRDLKSHKVDVVVTKPFETKMIIDLVSRAVRERDEVTGSPFNAN